MQRFFFFFFLTEIASALFGVGYIYSEGDTYTLCKDYHKMSKFLNRLLGMPVDFQNRLFQYFTDTVRAIVLEAKKSGSYDLDTIYLGYDQDMVKRMKLISFMVPNSTGVASIDLHTFEVDRGVSWEQAMEKRSLLVGPHEGFYITVEVSF